MVAQVAHSFEEYATRLYEVLPARFVSGLFSDDVAVGFVIANAIIITVGMGCYVGPVRSGRGAARLVAWVWAVMGLANGIGHIILAVLARGYFPGAMTAVALVFAAASRVELESGFESGSARTASRLTTEPEFVYC